MSPSSTCDVINKKKHLTTQCKQDLRNHSFLRTLWNGYTNMTTWNDYETTLQYGVHDCSHSKVPFGDRFIPFGKQWKHAPFDCKHRHSTHALERIHHCPVAVYLSSKVNNEKKVFILLTLYTATVDMGIYCFFSVYLVDSALSFLFIFWFWSMLDLVLLLSLQTMYMWALRTLFAWLEKSGCAHNVLMAKFVSCTLNAHRSILCAFSCLE